MLTLDTFYTCKDWLRFRQVVINERLTEDGQTICEYCNKPIVRAYDIILHHKEELTEDNVNDHMISLNPDNIMLVHHKCHNIIHDKLGHKERGVYLVYGAPLAGKKSYVSEVLSAGDLVIDMDDIWQCISGCDRYIKPNRLKGVAFGVRDYLLDCIKYRRGFWQSAYIIGGYPLASDRERICREFGAQEIFIDTDKAECMKRLFAIDGGEALHGYINDWFERYTPPY